jgi:multidrug efflux system membrane fusion protein
VDPTTGVFRASARFENASETIWPGMVLNCKAQLGTDRGALVVPSAAVQDGPKGNFVYVVDQQSTARVTPVRVGRMAADRTTLVAGVVSGETIVVEGQSRLTDGARVAARP